MDKVECISCGRGALEVVAVGTAKVIFKCKCGAYTIINLNEDNE